MECVLLLMLVAHLIPEKKRIINHRKMTVVALKRHLIEITLVRNFRRSFDAQAG